MIRWHHVAHGVVRGKEFDIEIASVEAGFIARALVEGAPPLEDNGVSPSEHAAVGAAAGRAYAFAHASTRCRTACRNGTVFSQQAGAAGTC